MVKTGGISGAYEALRAARQAGLQTMIGCMIESSVLITAAAHLAALADHLDGQIRDLELYLVRHAKVDDPQAYQRLQTIPGVGKVLALVLLYEIHDAHRFADVRNFVSYCRLVRPRHESNGKSTSATRKKKIGSAPLRWALGEAACLMLRELPQAKSLLARLEKKHGKPKALAILAARIARCAYWMLKRKEAFDVNRFFHN